MLNYGRVSGAKARKARQIKVTQTCRSRQRNFPAEIGRMIFGFFLCLLDRTEHLLGFKIENLALWRERQLAALMIEKLQSELLFERLDLQRYR